MRRLVALLLGGALLLAACRGGGSASDAGTSASRSAEASSGADASAPAPRAEPGDPLHDSERAMAERLRGLFPGIEPTQRRIGLDELLVGQVPDGIPSIDAPRFVEASDAEAWLDGVEPVVVLEIAGDARAYPLQILMWHEIVNDVVGGTPVAVTFCPLCNTAITFERAVDGKPREFGVSGLLRRSDLVMYDRTANSLWQQITGEAIVGVDAGARLAFVPSVIASFEEFRKAYPDGQVLSRDTGFSRDYGRNPYSGYDEVGSGTLFRVAEFDDGRLDAKERVLTVELEGDAVAFPFGALSSRVVIESEVAGQPVVAFWQSGAVSALDESFIVGSRNVGSAAAYRPLLDGGRLTFEAVDGKIIDMETASTWDVFGRGVDGPLAGRALEPLPSGNHFWFAWSVFQPETRVVPGDEG